MKNSLILLASILLFAASFSSCRSTYLLKEDFSGDRVGALPIKSLPGDPVGDSVVYKPILHPWLKIEPTVGTSGRALVFSEAPGTPDGAALDRYITFKGVASDYSQPLWFFWTGKQRNSTGTLSIDIIGAQGLWVARLEILMNGQLSLIRNVADAQNKDVLGRLNPQQTHTIH